MIGLIQRHWGVWTRTVSIAAAVMAIVVSASAMSSDIDQRPLPAQSVVASAAGAGVTESGPAQPAPDTNCHAGLGCTPVFLPADDLYFSRFVGAPELLPVTGFSTFMAEDVFFHPPRVLSKV